MIQIVSSTRLCGLLAWLLAFSQLPAARCEEQNGMVRIRAQKAIVGTSTAERGRLARRFDCHPGRATTRQFFWFLEGNLEELSRRVAQDLR